MRLRLFCLFIILIVSASHLFPFIYEIQVLRYWNQLSGCCQYVILCSDFHDAQHDALSNQRPELLGLIQNSKVDSVSITLEDLHSPNLHGEQKCSGYRLHCSQGLLAGLTKDCKALGIDVVNVEYRYARAIALSGIFDGISYYRPAHDIYVKSIFDEIFKSIREISHYSGCEILKRYYKKVCSSTADHQLFYDLKKKKYTSVAHYCQRFSDSGGNNFLKRLLTFDSSLLDCKLIRQIVSNNRSRVLLVVAGGMHCANVFKALSLVSYELIEKVSNVDRFHTKNLIGAQIACGNFFSKKPRPVNLNLVKKYLCK